MRQKLDGLVYARLVFPGIYLAGAGGTALSDVVVKTRPFAALFAVSEDAVADYTTKITGDVCGYLNEEEVEELLREIKDLEPDHVYDWDDEEEVRDV